MEILRVSKSFAALVLIGGSMGTAYAGTTECNESDAAFVEKLRKVDGWSSLYVLYKENIPSCPDDGMYAEGYSELVIRSLASRWAELSELQELIGKDESFRVFVLRHIDATGAKDNLDMIYRNSRRSCPAGVAKLCKSIGVEAKSALRSQRE